MTVHPIRSEAKMRGVPEDSAEYKQLEKISNNYMNLVTKYERMIERSRV